MAIAQGGFKNGAVIISATSVGAYSYAAGSTAPHLFAGVFFIDTGYDDPVLWTAGVEAAEVYGARVYATGTTVGSAVPGAGTYIGKWHIGALPVWQAKQWQTPHGNTQTQRRILIKCECYLLEPYSTIANAYEHLDSVDWSLYRI